MKDYKSRSKYSKDNYETPDYFFKLLDNEFHFTIDVCADGINRKLNRWIDEEIDGLGVNWKGHTCWCNPPFKELKHWARKCSEEGQKENTTVVMICPARTDTRYWHKYIMKAYEIRLCKGRINFLLNGTVSKNVNFPLVIAVFKKHDNDYPLLSSFYHKEEDLNNKLDKKDIEVE